MTRSNLPGLRLGTLVYLLSYATIAAAAGAEPARPAQTAPTEPILLWPAGAPGSEGKTGPEVVTNTDGYHRVSAIHKPTLIPYLPRAGATGAAVIVMPGGGHKYLAIDNEGHAVAAWLSGHGVAAFVLKYRLAREEGSTYKVEEHALADAQRALRLVRSRAKGWGIDPARVGVLGFSAGGQLATYAATRFDPGKTDAPDPINRQSDRPSFAGLVYPGGPLAEIEPPKDAPPAFLCAAADDKGPTHNALALFQKLRDGGIDAELHIYSHGGHGFGMKDRPLPVSAWATRFQEWLGDEGFFAAGRAADSDRGHSGPDSGGRGEVNGMRAPVQRRMAQAAATLLLLLAGSGAVAGAAEPGAEQLDRQFAATVRPFLQKHCLDCHGGAKPKADLDLGPAANLAAVIADLPRWKQIEEKLTAAEMPPRKAVQPPPEARKQVIAWIAAVRAREARLHAGDPGPVLARRLSNAEYNHTIRDLTGVDMQPAREFPVDPSNPEGFDNSGESLAMSPALLGKYLQAAREVANHLVLASEGIAFAPHPMLVETDRDKYTVKQIVDFYQRQVTDYAAYFGAAWRYKHRAALGHPQTSLGAVAAETGVSPKYLTTVWRALEGSKETVGPLAKVQALWRALPAPRPGQMHALETGCAAMRDYVVSLRQKLAPRFASLATKGVRPTAQPFAMWKNRQYATHRLTCNHDALQIDGQPLVAAATAGRAADKDGANDPADDEASSASAPARTAADPDLTIPAADRARHEAAFDRFCATFPDAFYVAERGRRYPEPSREKGQLLSAGFLNLMGYFRDDQPLVDLVLDPASARELDRLWRELDFVAAATRRTYLQFVFNGDGRDAIRKNAAKPGQAGAAVGELGTKDVTSAAAIDQMKQMYLAKAGADADPTAKQAIVEHFDGVNAALRWTETARAAAASKHLEALLAFAERAYRRPLTAAERDDLRAYYRQLRDKGGLDHEEAMRDLLVSVLMAPDFCYRIDLVAGPGVRPLSDQALASRLSYFLWSSMPDDQLMAHANAGDLHRPQVMVAQARRMLRDPRVRGLATEFGGSWLDFRGFEQHNAVDRQRFPAFDDALRSAMFEEPIRFLLDVFGAGSGARGDRSVLDFLYADDTFVNPVLAKHYGMPVPSDPGTDWVRIKDAGRYGRGGLLPMAVFLTKNAPGLRTSPVKRGHWVVKNILGEQIPPPPAVVPELPRDEAKLDLPLRDVLAQHRQDAACAGCHARFDSLGLVFEGYGPVGEQRSQDLAGRAVDAHATFPGAAHVEGNGLPGLRQYLRAQRQGDFIDNLCRKLLAYALGRSLMPSDDAAVTAMRARLSRDRYHFDSLIESVVTSPQFLTKRGPDGLAVR